jgi:hypothetical protein
MLVVIWVVDVKIFLEKRHNKGIDTLVVLKKKLYMIPPAYPNPTLLVLFLPHPLPLS